MSLPKEDHIPPMRDHPPKLRVPVLSDSEKDAFVLNDETHESYLEALRVPSDFEAESIPDFEFVKGKFMKFEAERSQEIIIGAALRLIVAGHADIVARELARNLDVMTSARSGAAEVYKNIVRNYLSGIENRKRQHVSKLIKSKTKRSPLYSDKINLVKVTKMLVQRALIVSLSLLRIESNWTLTWGIEPTELQVACMNFVHHQDVDALRRIVSAWRLLWVPSLAQPSSKTATIADSEDAPIDLDNFGPLKQLKGVSFAIKLKVWKALQKSSLKVEPFDNRQLREVADLEGNGNAVSKCLKILFDAKILKRHGNAPRYQYTVNPPKNVE